MSAYRMLVVDLDGTAVTREDRLTGADIRAAHRLRELGVHLSIATGRLYTGTRWVAEALGVEGTVAVMNGSEYVDVQADRTVRGTFLSVQEREIVRDAVREAGLSAALYRARQIHHDHRDARHVPYFKIWTPELEAHEDLLSHAIWTGADDALAIGVLGPAEAIHQTHAALSDVLEKPAGMVLFDTFEGDRFLSVRHQTEDKGTAIAQLAADRGLRTDEVVVVGDWLNDLPMLRVAGRSYAMNGAIDAARDAAHETLDAQRGEGGAIAEIARKVWGI